jgi:hypothetical protein
MQPMAVCDFRAQRGSENSPCTAFVGLHVSKVIQRSR